MPETIKFIIFETHYFYGADSRFCSHVQCCVYAEQEKSTSEPELALC